MADRDGWQPALEAELRNLGREIGVPPAADVTPMVRQRLAPGPAARRRLRARGMGSPRRWRPAWRAAVVIAAVLATILVATPQGRAVIGHVLRFAGIELRQGPGQDAAQPGAAASWPGSGSRRGHAPWRRSRHPGGPLAARRPHRKLARDFPAGSPLAPRQPRLSCSPGRRNGCAGTGGLTALGDGHAVPAPAAPMPDQ